MAVKFGDKPFIHICECCGKREVLTAKEAYEDGWDYPGEGGVFPESMFGTIGPRTCGACSMTGTLWWQLAVEKKKIYELSEHQREILSRILQEPDVYVVEQGKE